MLDLRHGGHILVVNPDKDLQAVGVEATMGYPIQTEEPPKETPFAYLFADLEEMSQAHLPGLPKDVVEGLKALGTAMVDTAPGVAADAVEVNSSIPAAYTYWGQFIDHDMTANTDRDSVVSDITAQDLQPIPPDTVKEKLKNLRRPTLDLDSLYGNGPDLAGCYRGRPDAGLYDGIKLRVGRNFDGPAVTGVKIPPTDDLNRDLPRIGPLIAQGVITLDDLPDSLRNDPNRDTRAFVGDLRNDENLIVAQLHLAFLRFHNRVVDKITANPAKFGLDFDSTESERFRTARQLVRFHYQWLVIHDYLETITIAGMPDKVLVGGNKVYRPLADDVLFAPLEYSVAAFRFGHTMVRGAYDHNRNFGRPEAGANPVIPVAPFDLLFLFTGNGFGRDPNDPTKSVRNPFAGDPTLPFNWVIEWDRFTNKGDANRAHYARKIDTKLAPPIHNMVNEGTGAAIQDDANPPNTALRMMLRDLAQRNLVRGYLLSIPTGQAVAAALGVPALTEAEILQGNDAAVITALQAGGFEKNTPLWFYILKEAEIRANGNSLGEVGSRIVAETLVGLLRFDPRSFLNFGGGWSPADGVTLPNGDPIVTIRDFFAFAGLTA